MEVKDAQKTATKSPFLSYSRYSLFGFLVVFVQVDDDNIGIGEVSCVPHGGDGELGHGNFGAGFFFSNQLKAA
jgi:hypothetical protein